MIDIKKIYEIKFLGIVVGGVGFLAIEKIIEQKRLQQSIINHAKKYLGVREVGGDDNGFSNKEFEFKLRSLGWATGMNWCLFFVKLVLLETFREVKQAKLYNYVMYNFTHGRTQETWKNILRNKKSYVKILEKPEPGTIVFWRRIDKPELGHVGIVVKSEANIFYTIEGNTDNRVILKKRFIPPEGGNWQLLGFVKFKA